MRGRLHSGARKPPAAREGRKHAKPKHGLKPGQTVQLRRAKKTGSAAQSRKSKGKSTAFFLRDATEKGHIVVRKRESHPKKITKKVQREADRLDTEQRQLVRRLENLWQRRREGGDLARFLRKKRSCIIG